MINTIINIIEETMMNDLYISIADFLSTKDMFNLSYICKDSYSSLMYSQYNMTIHAMKLNKHKKNLEFIANLPYKIYNLNLNNNGNLTDYDFKYLKGIHSLNMSSCNQNTITDKAFENLKGIHTLNISNCNQITITDRAFKYLKGI